MNNPTEEMMASALEVKHRQLCLARSGLWMRMCNLVEKSHEVFKAMTLEEREREIDKIVELAVAVDYLKSEAEGMEKSADDVAHKMNTAKAFFDMLSGLKSRSREKEE